MNYDKKKIRLVVFDLDGTLADIGKGTLPENVERLKELEQQGLRIAICSGKTVDYLCGFARQLGLEKPVLVGENGAVIQLGIDLPPRDFYLQEISPGAREAIAFLKQEIQKALPGLFYQANLIGLTPFPTCQQEFEIIQNIIDENRAKIQDVVVYRHSDSFDIVPKGIDKKSGLTRLGELLQIHSEETVAVGNGINDYPMFAYAGVSVGVSLPDPKQADHNFAQIEDALDFLLQQESGQAM